MSARHLRVGPDGERIQPITASSARSFVVALGQRYTLELFDPYAALVDVHDPEVAVGELHTLRQNAVNVVGYTFDLLTAQADRRRGA